ncbi:MAG: HAMP domain-containing histidine kinase [Oscillospiraceae bacterium]|nr:HAMP domain-containing histidine kinase [Oscillospiraceae bacterium]
MFKKLRNKFLIMNMLITSLVMLGAFGAVYVTTRNSVNAEINRKVDNMESSFSYSVRFDDENESVEFRVEDNNENQKRVVIMSGNSGVTMEYILNSFIVTVDGFGEIIEVSSFYADVSDEDYKKVANTVLSQNKYAHVTFEKRLWAHKTQSYLKSENVGGVYFPDVEYYDIMFLDVTDSVKTLNDLLVTFALVGAAMSAVIFAISFLFANRIIRPISESWEKQKRFVADASHELKTPLTTIMTNCGVLRANESQTVTSQKEWLDSIEIGADRMGKLIGSLLTLARAEGVPVQIEKRSFVLRDLIDEIVGIYSDLANERNLRVVRDVAIDGEVYGHGEYVRQILVILYENAVKYTDFGGLIEVSAVKSKSGTVCTVKNTGDGLSAQDLPYVFDRFFRADAARNNDDGSHGLGLSIARSVAEQIGGKITVKSVEGEWTEFVFSF